VLRKVGNRSATEGEIVVENIPVQITIKGKQLTSDAPMNRYDLFNYDTPSAHLMPAPRTAFQEQTQTRTRHTDRSPESIKIEQSPRSNKALKNIDLPDGN
jgi:hypothetical protein